MSKHTDGPWVAMRMAGERWLIHQKTNEIDGGFFCEVAPLHTTREAKDTAIANARLIAAAPDLLQACKAFLTLFRDSDMRPEDECHELAATIRAAIAKAEKP